MPPTKPVEVPTYPDNQAPLPVAHEGELKISRITFAGIDSSRVPEAVRITAIEAKGMLAGEGGPLFKSTPDGLVALKAGDIIERADFGNIRWHAEDNQGGQFSFTPLASSGEPIEASLIQTVGIAVHPEPPNYPSKGEDLQVANNSTQAIASSLFSGLDPSRRPAGIRITAINPRHPEDAEAPALVFGPNKEKVAVNWFIHAKDFDQLAWDSAHNEGGSFRFEAANADGTSLLGAVPQRVKIIEHPAPPDYPDQPASLSAGHNADLVLDERHFVGREASKKPAAIRITAIEATGSGADIGSALSVTKPGASRSLNVGSLVQADEFGWITWHAGANEGGRFSFEALTADGVRILGSETHGLSIQEQPAPVVEPTEVEGELIRTIIRDKTALLGRDAFLGAKEKPQVAAIRIEAIEADGLMPGRSIPLLWDQQNRGSSSGAVRVKEGQTLDVEALNRLYWEGNSQYRDGTIRYVLLDTDGHVLPDTGEQTLRLEEMISAAPVHLSQSARSALPAAKAVLNGHVKIPLAQFGADDPSKAPDHVRVRWSFIRDDDEVRPPPGYSPLLLNRGSGDPVPVEQDQIIHRDDLGKLFWSARYNRGGEIQYEVLDSRQQGVIGIDEQRIFVTEGLKLPVISNLSSTSAQVPDGQIIRYSTSNLIGNDRHGYTANAIRIDAIHEIDDTDQGASALMLQVQGTPGSPGYKPRQDLRVNDIVEAEDISRVAWDTTANRGGHFSFTPLDSLHKPIEGLPPVTYRAIEFGPVPAYLGTPAQRLPAAAQGITVWSLTGSGQGIGPVGSQVEYFRHDHEIPFNQLTRLDRNLFAGTDPDREPHAILIYQDPFARLNQDASLPLLTIRRPSGEIVPVKANDKIVAADFDHLYWDSTRSTVGQLHFIPVDSNGHFIHKESETLVAVQLRLTSGPIPLAGGTLDAPLLGHDTISRFDKDVFFNVLGLPSQSEMGSKRYRFLSYTEQTEDGRKIYPYVLSRVSDAKAYELVTLDQAVNKTVAARMASERGGKLLQVENTKNKTWLDEYFFKAQGTSFDQVLHDNSDGKAQSAAFVVQYDQYKPALFHFANDQTQHSKVWLDGYYGAAALSNLAWRSENNQGGSITIAEVDPAYRGLINSATDSPATILPDTTVTITFTEMPASGSADAGRQGKQVTSADAVWADPEWLDENALPATGGEGGMQHASVQAEAASSPDASSASSADEADETEASRATAPSDAKPAGAHKLAVQDPDMLTAEPKASGAALSLPELLQTSPSQPPALQVPPAGQDSASRIGLMIPPATLAVWDEPWTWP